MTSKTHAKELKAIDLEVAFDVATLGFDSTDELQPLDEILGQPRAMKALDLGLGIRHPTYNVYVAGLSGTGKQETIKQVLNERVVRDPPPRDWIYIHNFDEPDRPIAAPLEPGKGTQLRKDMQILIDQLRNELPQAFRQEDFTREKQRIGREYGQKNQEVFQDLEKKAKEKGLTIQQMPNGQIGMAPLKGDQPMTEEEFKELPDDEKEEMTRRQRELAEQMESVMSRTRELKRRLDRDVREVEADFAKRIVEPRIDEISQRYEQDTLRDWFRKVSDHIVGNLDHFRQTDDTQEQKMARMMGVPVQDREQSFSEYSVNVLVDNGKLDHAPVVIEDAPNYKNLFGTIGGAVDRFGRVTGDFTHIRAGSLLRANGGYLVINLLEALIEPLAWKELKRSIKSGKVEFHAYDPLGVFTASAIRPEPIPLNVKLVVLGSPLVYHLLYLYDEDFGEIFKVKADFAGEMDRTDETGRHLGRFVQKIVKQESVSPFSVGGVTELARTATRLAENKNKITAEFSQLADLIRESGYWARQAEADVVDAVHVRRAADEKVYRSDLIAAKIRELIADGTLLISLDGKAIGQINGLGIINLGDYAFGKPSRVTASVGLGAAGVINIERESKLSGQTYDKAMLILDGYMRNIYAKAHPLALSAGIAMEQSYGMIEGDSASVTELVCLLSAIAEVPLRQDIGITGSVNQWGETQAIGGVNEKIEGFFDVCKQGGLTGKQGVCIPHTNLRNLILRPDVVDAVRDGKFHVWTIKHVDEALELVGGLRAGDPRQEGSFHGKVSDRLRDMVATLKEQRAVTGERPVTSVQPTPDTQRDPRPPLPGRE